MTRDNTDALLSTLLLSLKLLPRPLPVPHLQALQSLHVIFWSLSTFSLSLSRLPSPVVLMATSPAYFRGFILIALKEGREGTSDGDYVGQYQVSARQREGKEGEGVGRRGKDCCVLRGKFCSRSFACCSATRETTWLFPPLSPGCEGERC